MTNPIDTQTRDRNGSLLAQGDQYIRGSMTKDPDGDGDVDSGYGQNGYTGASSDLPGQHTCSGFLPECKLPEDYKGKDWQTRSVSTKPLAPAHGMKVPGAVKMTNKVSYK